MSYLQVNFPFHNEITLKGVPVVKLRKKKKYQITKCYVHISQKFDKISLL